MPRGRQAGEFAPDSSSTLVLSREARLLATQVWNEICDTRPSQVTTGRLLDWATKLERVIRNAETPEVSEW